MTTGHVSDTKKQKRGMLRKETLLDAFLQLAAQHGIFQVSLEQVAQHSGVAKATVYKHFVSKDEMLALVYLRFYEPLNEQLASLPTDLAVVPRLRLGVQAYLAYHLQDPAVGSLIMVCKHFVDPRKLSEPLAAHWQSFRQQRTALADAIIKRGIDEQVFRHVDPQWLTEVGLRMLDGVLSCFFEMNTQDREKNRAHLSREAEEMLIKSFMRI